MFSSTKSFYLFCSLRYPCSTPKAEFRESKISSDPISCVRFLFDDIYVLASSGSDAALVRWKVK